MIDGEAVILGLDGVSDFDALHSGKHNEEVQLYAFDILVLGQGFPKNCWPVGKDAAGFQLG